MGAKLRAQVLRIGAQDFDFRIQGSGFRLEGLGFTVYCSGLTDLFHLAGLHVPHVVFVVLDLAQQLLFQAELVVRAHGMRPWAS